jgi:hypothetical protein
VLDVDSRAPPARATALPQRAQHTPADGLAEAALAVQRLGRHRALTDFLTATVARSCSCGGTCEACSTEHPPGEEDGRPGPEVKPVDVGSLGSPSSGSKSTVDRPVGRATPTSPGPADLLTVLGLQRAVGNAAVTKLIPGPRRVQRAPDGGMSALEAAAQEQIAAAKAKKATAGDGGPGTAGDGGPGPGTAGDSTQEPGQSSDREEETKLKLELGATVSPPDVSEHEQATRQAASGTAEAATAPSTPVVAGGSPAPPQAQGGHDPHGPAAAAGEAAQLADKAAASATEVTAPGPPAPVELPSVAPVDAGGRPVPPDAQGDAMAAALAGRVDALRQGAHTVLGQAAAQKAAGHTLEAQIKTVEAHIGEAESGVATIKAHAAHRREVTTQARQALDVSKQKAETVAAGAPQVASKSEEGKSKSGPMASGSQSLAGDSASHQPEDSEAAGKAQEQGNQLTKVGADTASIDDTIGKTTERAASLGEEAAQAKESNSQSEAKVTAAEAVIGQTDQKATELGQANQAARAQLAGVADGPAQMATEGGALDEQGTAITAASDQLEARLHAAQQAHEAGMGSVPARQLGGGGTALQLSPDDDRQRVDTSGVVPEWLSGETAPSAQARQEAAAKEQARRQAELSEINSDAGAGFDNLSAADKAGIALRLTGRHLFGSLGATNIPNFVGGIIRGFIDPRVSLMGVVNGLGMVLSGAANLLSAKQWEKDPLGNLLKSSADIATGVTIVLGSIAGLAVAISVLLTIATVLTLGAIAPITGPIIAFCATVAATVGPWAITAAEIALVLQALVFIKNLIDAATATTAKDLQGKSDEMTEDATTAGSMAMQIGMAEAGEMIGGAGGEGGEPGGAAPAEAPAVPPEAPAPTAADTPAPGPTPAPADVPAPAPEVPAPTPGAAGPAEAPAPQGQAPAGPGEAPAPQGQAPSGGPAPETGVPPADAAAPAEVPQPGDVPEPGTASGPETPAPLEDGTPAVAGAESPDGNAQVKVGEDGTCEVCATPCAETRAKYADALENSDPTDPESLAARLTEAESSPDPQARAQAIADLVPELESAQSAAEVLGEFSDAARAGENSSATPPDPASEEPQTEAEDPSMTADEELAKLIGEQAADDTRAAVTDTAPGETYEHPTFEPGPYAGDSIPARSSDQTFTTAERASINEIGSETGCHTCGSTEPGTTTGNFIPDHQPVSALNTEGLPQRLFPHCLGCSQAQGLALLGRLALARSGQ